MRRIRPRAPELARGRRWWLMAKPFKTLIDKMSPESRERIAARERQLLTALALQELRQARRLTQQQLAESLEISQASNAGAAFTVIRD